MFTIRKRFTCQPTTISKLWSIYVQIRKGCAAMVRKIDTVKRLRLFGDFLMLGIFLMLLWVFLSAYFTNDYTTTVHVNSYGEAHLEMIILVFILLPLFLITTALSFIDWRQTWKAKEKILSQRYLMRDASMYRHNMSEGEVICPRCGDMFLVRVPHSGGSITCPTCGLMGWYSPSEVEDSGVKDKPEVKIIKNIRS
jgi:uncharacterized paraquat-inducible protein A